MPANSSLSIEISDVSRLPERYVVTDTLARIGNSAWFASLPERSKAEVDHVYPEESDEFAQEWSDTFKDLDKAEYAGRMRTYGKGVLLVADLVASDTDVSRMVGYAFIRNNVSGSRLQRAVKTYAYRRPPFAWVQSINVLPEYQHHGIGSALLAGAVQYFDRSQPSTAYVYGENPRARKFFEGLGYQATQDEPTVIENRFGPGTKPVSQYRLQADTLKTVVKAAIEVIDKKDLQVIYT